MFKLRPLVRTSRLVLYRRGLDNCVACFSRSPCLARKEWQERETCPPRPPPPDPPAKDRRLLWGMVAISAISGCLAVYAKKDPEFRDWLSIYAPWFDDFVAMVYQENMTYQELVEYSLDNVKEYVSPTKRKPRQCSLDGNPPPPCAKGGDNEVRVECPPDKPVVKEGERLPCQVEVPPVITKNICELEGCIKEQAEVACNSYMTARDACKCYNEMMAIFMTDVTPGNLREMSAAKDERMELVNEHVAIADEAAKNLNGLTRYMDCGITDSKERVENTKRLLLEMQTMTKRTQIEYQWAEEISLALDEQLQTVTDMVTKFTNEVETLFPSVKYDSPKPQLVGDADLLLIHCKRYLIKLRGELLEEAALMRARSARAVDVLPPPKDDKQKKERDKLTCEKIQNGTTELDKWYKTRYDAISKESERLLQCALKKQKDQLQRVLDVKLKQKESMITDDLDRLLKEAVGVEKKVFDKDLAEMAKKVKAAEDNMEAHLKAEREARKSQDLWAAGASLLAATKKGGRRVRVTRELDTLRKVAGADDKLVNSVLNSIPANIRTDGVVPWNSLRDRYYTMEEVARKVALVEQEGAHLGVFIISYIQSMFLFLRLNGIPKEDIENPMRENMDDLDTFDILQRARYWVQQGNLAAAVNYVNALKGASRAAAAAWRADAHALLEVRQAAEAILAHAAALGLQYV